MKKYYMATTVNPNTPASDLEPEVMHLVEWLEDEENHEAFMMAADPIDAIAKMKAKHARQE